MKKPVICEVSYDKKFSVADLLKFCQDSNLDPKDVTIEVGEETDWDSYGGSSTYATVTLKYPKI